MKALTLTQPWASAVALGLKRVETRSWSTHYRGPIAIHAAKGFPGWAKEVVWDRLTSPGPWQDMALTPSLLPVSAVVATARLVNVVPTGLCQADLTEDEVSWGDFAPGRYAWFLEDIVALPEPIPAKGALGLWEWANA